MIDGLGFIRLEVKDLERSIAFYRDGLRFVLGRRDDGDPPRAWLHAADLTVILRLAAPIGRGRRGAGVRVSVRVAGVDAYHDALVARGLTPAPPVDANGLRRFTIADPDGYEWAFSQAID